jgi:hypothetical protein
VARTIDHFKDGTLNRLSDIKGKGAADTADADASCSSDAHHQSSPQQFWD